VKVVGIVAPILESPRRARSPRSTRAPGPCRSPGPARTGDGPGCRVRRSPRGFWCLGRRGSGPDLGHAPPLARRAPAACWWARTTVLSISSHSRSGSPPRAASTPSSAPRSIQRSYRRWTARWSPRRSGRSRQRPPERAIQSSASTKRRLSSRPTLPGTSSGDQPLQTYPLVVAQRVRVSAHPGQAPNPALRHVTPPAGTPSPEIVTTAQAAAEGMIEGVPDTIAAFLTSPGASGRGPEAWARSAGT